MNYALIDNKSKNGSTIAVLTILNNKNNNQFEIAKGNKENLFNLETGKDFAILRINKLEEILKETNLSLTILVKDTVTHQIIAKKNLQVN